MQVTITVNDMPNEPIPQPQDPRIPQIPIPPNTDKQQFLRQSRKDALTIAMQNKPGPYYDTSQNKLITPLYDVVSEAEKIYDFLIKDL